MSRRKIKANELVDTDVSFVSLVKRGANRIPFRITKEDGPMLDLYKIGRSLFHKADSRPQIVAAVFQKGADLTKVAALFQKAGLEPKKFVKSEKGGVVTVAKADAAAAEDTMVVKMSDSFGLVVSGLKKSFDENDFSGTIYGEPLAKGGYVPSPRLAYAMLGEAVSQAFLKSADAEAMTSLLKTATRSEAKRVLSRSECAARTLNGTGRSRSAGSTSTTSLSRLSGTRHSTSSIKSP